MNSFPRREVVDTELLSEGAGLFSGVGSDGRRHQVSTDRKQSKVKIECIAVQQWTLPKWGLLRTGVLDDAE